ASVRVRYWTEIFIPVYKDYAWLGSGGDVPPEVPPREISFVDNEYLGLGFRAGLVGIALLGSMLVTVGVNGWRSRYSPDPWRRAMGGVVLSYVCVLAVMGVTASYLTYGGVAQQFWMMIGLFGATLLPTPNEQRG